MQVENAQAVEDEDLTDITREELNLPESWHCVDCGFDTAPGMQNRDEMWKEIEEAKAAGKWDKDWRSTEQKIDKRSEVYSVRGAIWRKAGMESYGGCLCIGCLEKRIRRRLKPKDFDRHHPFNRPDLPCTERLRDRRGGSHR
jgi:hypothetical protein